MKKNSTKMKKSISLALTFAMVFSMFSTWSLPVHAVDEDLTNQIVTEAEPEVIEKVEPTVQPTSEPEVTEEAKPTVRPSAEPEVIEEAEPTVQPSAEPEVVEKVEPTVRPTATPEVIEKAEPTVQPTVAPTQVPVIEEKVFDVEKAYNEIIALESEEAINSYMSALSEEENAQLRAFANEKLEAALANEKTPETVSVTKAGPFMPAVNVAVARVMMFANTAEDDGIELSKDVKLNSDGTYKITLESYTTGTVKTESKVSPVDVILVLDQSGSMNYNFEGSGNSKERQNAMKNSVNKFIDSVSAKYDENADHRIALVEFRGDAKIIRNWTDANAEGAKALKNTIKGLNAEGATNIGAGMHKAEELMGSKYNYTGKNTERQKVVIVFTDGSPTTSNYFSGTVADDAIKSSKKLKDAGVTVYSVGIFNGADPEESRNNV